MMKMKNLIEGEFSVCTPYDVISVLHLKRCAWLQRMTNRTNKKPTDNNQYWNNGFRMSEKIKLMEEFFIFQTYSDIVIIGKCKRRNVY